MPDRDRLYDEAVEVFGAAVERLARSYELDAHKRQDPFEARIAFVVENGESTALILRQGGVEQRARSSGERGAGPISSADDSARESG